VDTKTLCLGALSFGDASGYEIKKQVEGSFGHFLAVSYGSIYPALNELCGQGLIACTVVSQDVRPDKKVYRLTDAGRSKLREELMGCRTTHKVRSEFLFVLCFAAMLTPERLLSVLDGQVEEFERNLRLVQLWLKRDDLSTGARFAAGFGDAVMRAAVEFIRTNKGMVLAGGGAQ
jgi:PadR family transcriptional regulator, regulatory protein AphA